MEIYGICISINNGASFKKEKIEKQLNFYFIFSSGGASTGQFKRTKWRSWSDIYHIGPAEETSEHNGTGPIRKTPKKGRHVSFGQGCAEDERR